MGFKVPKGVEYITKTIRISEKNNDIIVNLAKENKKSFNKVLNAMIDFAIENMEKE